MCGIAGIRTTDIAPPNHSELVHEAIGRIAHRGPDFQDVFSSQSLTLGHARLSIIDLQDRANQPMTAHSGRYVLAFNGEIYNYKKLRSKLEAGGIQFHTESDTEVLLHMLITHGSDALRLLNGCFAFAFSDTHKNSLLLARDRMGINPMWYAFSEDQKTCYFASEAKALNSMMGFPGINQQALPYYLRFNFLPGNQSLMKNRHKLAPGHFLQIDKNGVKTQEWYSLESTFKKKVRPIETDLFQIMEQAVQARLISDVPIGSFLSGGLDSSIIAALAARSHSEIETFSIGFRGSDYFDETNFAKEVADHIGSKHHAFQLSEEDLALEARSLIAGLDETFADSSALPMSFLSRQTRQHVSVALSGDGADELFAGYRKHRGHLKAVNWNNPVMLTLGKIALGLTPKLSSRGAQTSDQIRRLRKLAAGLQLTPENRYKQWASFAPDEFMSACGFDANRLHINHLNWTNEDELNTVLLADQQFILPNDMLHKVDLMSMRHGLEVRTPFLDHRVVEWANGLEAGYKFGPTQGKAILRTTFSDLLPPRIISRSKKGFEIPLEKLLGGALREEIIPLTRKSTLESLGIPQPERAALLVQKFTEGQFPGMASTVWALYVLMAWMELHQSGVK
jgi:asparagine synthase (glutamine-hydrolysing)